jgi:hypothetical protein
VPVTDVYATVAEYRTRVGRLDPGAGDDALIAADLLAISRYLDRKLGRFFTQDAAPVARTYTTAPARWGVQMPAGMSWDVAENPWRAAGLTRVLHIDDLVAVTEIVVDEGRDGSFVGDVPLTPNDYLLLPQNAPLGPEPRPYTAIELTPWGRLIAWPALVRVRVTGIWGWPAVPEPVRAATIELARLLRLETPRATTRVNETLDQVVSTSPQARAIVDDLVRQYARVRL